MSQEIKAIILAAGKGTRMGDLSVECPKPLLKVAGKNLIEWKINNLPEEITEVILVVWHLKEKIISYFGDTYKGRKISYIDAEPHGTGHAVWKCKEVAGERFVVLMGDDLYSKESIRKVLEHPLSVAVKHSEGPHKSVITLNEEGNFTGIDDSAEQIGFVNTGLYSLTKDIFDFELVKVPGREEWGLPHTLVEVGKKYPIKVVETKHWHQINSPKELGVDVEDLVIFE